MNRKNSSPVIFDDDFEVTYEDDSLDILNFDDDEYDDSYDNYERPSKRKRRNKVDKPVSRPAKKAKKLQSKTDKIPNIEHAIKKEKPKAYGNRHIYDTSFYVIRTASIIISISIIIVLALEFIRGAALFGNLNDIINNSQLDILLYVSVSGFIVLFYTMSLLFSFKRKKVIQNGREYKLDMGRGTSIFVSLYLLSYASFIFCAIVPEHIDLSAIDALNGIVGALDVFGSMHNILLGLCVAGAVSCIARKNMN